MKHHALSRKIILSFLIVCLCIGTLCLYNGSDKNVTNAYISLSHATDISDPVKLLGISNNVFTGKVKKQLYTKERDHIPYTFFAVDVEENIKGTLKGEILVKQLGGNKNSVIYIIKEDHPLIVGDEYLFAARYDKENNAYTIIPVYGDINLASQDSFISSKKNFSKNVAQLSSRLSQSTNLVEIYKEAFGRSTDFDSNITDNSQEKLKEDAQLNRQAYKK